LISLKKSFDKRPEISIDEDVQKFKEFIQGRRAKWTEEEKIELETDKFDNDESLKNTNLLFSEMPHIAVGKESMNYVRDNYKIIGFDESSNTFSGTYARLASFKFGECHLTFKDGEYQKEKIMYKPITTYIEDNEHKLIIYKTVIENFVKTIKREFYVGKLKDKVDKLEEWFETTYKKKIDDHINSHAFYYPTLGHVVDRIRTADEILKTLIRIKEISNWGKNENVIFLGDGIQMFRQHIFPPTAFTEFFYRFIQLYKIKYYSFSKTCRLRDAQGNFLLPIWSVIYENKNFLVDMPDLSMYTKSRAYLTRLQQDSSALRFDICDDLDTKDALYVIKNLIPYAPRGYPLCLVGAHEASTLLASEFNKLEAAFLELQYDPKTRKYAQKWRHKVLGV